MKFRKSKALFIPGLVLAFWTMSVWCFGFTTTAIAEQLILKAGTPVLLRVDKSITTEYANVGDPVDLIVVRDVKVGDTIVIERGTLATGQVSEVQKSGVVGKPGKISIVVDRVPGKGNVEVPLRAALTREGKGKQTSALLVGLILCILGLFLIKGESGVIQAGSEIKAYVDFDVEFNLLN
jgi:hypothetical protein